MIDVKVLSLIWSTAVYTSATLNRKSKTGILQLLFLTDNALYYFSSSSAIAMPIVNIAWFASLSYNNINNEQYMFWQHLQCYLKANFTLLFPCHSITHLILIFVYKKTMEPYCKISLLKTMNCRLFCVTIEDYEILWEKATFL